MTREEVLTRIDGLSHWLAAHPKAVGVLTEIREWAEEAVDPPSTAPCVKGSSTSKAAARTWTPAMLKSTRRQVYDYITAQGANGATDDEIEQDLELRHQTASARRRELVQAGLVFDSRTKRATRSGCLATVWTIRRTHGQEAPQPR